MDSVEPEFIQDTKSTGIASSKDLKGIYDFHFKDGMEEEFDIVASADGARSIVRTSLTDRVPEYFGITIIELKSVRCRSRTKYQWFFHIVDSKSLFKFDEGRPMLC